MTKNQKRTNWRIYNNNIIEIQKPFNISESNRRRISKILRLKKKDKLFFFDSIGNEFLCEIFSEDLSQMNPIKKLKNFVENSFKIILFQAICKSEKMNFIIQKATELGIDEIHPFLNEKNKIRKIDNIGDKKLQKWQKICIAACEQCGARKIPKIFNPSTFNECINKMQANKYKSIIFLPEANKKISELNHKQSLNVVIGGESGFSARESAHAKKNNIDQFSLGKNILRSETASITAVAILQNLLGNI